MFRFRLSLRAVFPQQSKAFRRARIVLTCGWLALVCGLMSINAENPQPAESDQASPQQVAFPGNQPPYIMLYTAPQGDGIWLIWGHVYDELAYDMVVTLTCSQFPTEEVEVNAQGNFYHSVYCEGGSTVFANATDPYGLHAPEAMARLGF
jgi:hypothetical protein